jgi:hypothetical protein
METLIACGLADSNVDKPTPWVAFLTKGLYDPRLFLWIGVFKGETITELVDLALKGYEIESLSESMLTECRNLFREWTDAAVEFIEWKDTFLFGGCIGAWRLHVGSRKRKLETDSYNGNETEVWGIILARVLVPALLFELRGQQRSLIIKQLSNALSEYPHPLEVSLYPTLLRDWRRLMWWNILPF